MNISPVGKRLLDLMSSNNKTSSVVLERYIITIDENLDVDSLLRAIAKRMGIFIPDYETANVYLPLYIEYLLINYNVSEIEQILTLSEYEFNKTYKNVNYNDRLSLLK